MIVFSIVEKPGKIPVCENTDAEVVPSWITNIRHGLIGDIIIFTHVKDAEEYNMEEITN